MESSIFEDLYNCYIHNFSDGRGWNDLAKQYGYESGEALRSSFRRSRKKLGYSSKKELEIPEDTSIERKMPNSLKEVNILCLDTEWSYMQVGVFELFDQNIAVDQILEQSILICVSAKYLNSDKVISYCLTTEEILERNDKRIVNLTWNLILKSDVLIGHNLVGFDLKKLNTRFLYHGYNPLHKQTIDTYLIARNNFEFASNSLKFLNRYFGIKQKQENEGFKLWVKCMQGDKVALDTMQEYCNNDVLATIELYYKIRSFMKNPPNLSIYFEGNEKRCNNCGSEKIVQVESYTYLNSGKYHNYRCIDCGSIFRSKENELTKEKRKSLLV